MSEKQLKTNWRMTKLIIQFDSELKGEYDKYRKKRKLPFHIKRVKRFLELEGVLSEEEE